MIPRNAGAFPAFEGDRDKIAIIDLGGEAAPRHISYAALDAEANGVARALAMRGFAQGERIALLSANRAEVLAAFFGILRAGLVAVPVNHRFPRATIDLILRDCGARLVFCDARRAADCPADLETVIFGAPYERFRDPGDMAPTEPRPDEPALFLYTSGSTGRPKGVVLSHQGQNWVVAMRMAAGGDLSRHRYLIAAPLYHMNALALSQLVVAARATIVLMPQFEARGYIEAAAAWRATFLTAVPPMMAMMLREADLLGARDLSAVEAVRMGSAPVSASLMASLKRALPQAAVTNAYGTTEAGPVVFGPHPKGLKQPEMSVGYPHPQVQLRLRDGVLEMKCPALMLGYHNRPELHPFTEDGYYVTGDVFRRDEDGFYYFLGRNDDMFVSGGENIYPGDVERMLERHPDVAQALVVPIEDEIKAWKPVAFIVPKPGRAPSEGDIKSFALANAPAYQHPRFVFFLERLPLASTDKVDRAALVRLAAERIAR
ncbi:MAG TPA: class I adenylate-forming enzyme family protein [Stellaceae bacterium]|nr:class I adenylate-forming enzyme family protein [Stellaceae bacterium]